MPVPDSMKELAGQVVFSIGHEDYTWEDVVLAAQAWGDWDRLRQRARESLACLQRGEEEDPLTADAVESAANEFRYARDLVSADEMDQWLERWRLTVERWMDFVRASLLKQKWSEELQRLVLDYPPADDEVEGQTATEAVCSGELMRLARDLAGRAAIFEKEKASVGGVEEPSRPVDLSGVAARKKRLVRLDAGLRRFCDRLTTPEALRAQLRASQAEWTRLDVRSLAFPDEDSAREAALCVRQDGEDLDQVAGDANLLPDRKRIYIEEVDPDLQSRFLGAEKGELLGPVQIGSESVLYLVLDKALPSADDPDIVLRARDAILKSVLEREVNNRVKWRFPP